MSRELKFIQPVYRRDGSFMEWHVWGIGITEEGKIANVGHLTFNLGITDPKNSFQYTNLKDGKGNEIYDGSLVKFYKGGVWFVCQVIWNTIGAWTLKWKGGYINNYFLNNESFEVIGHIISTPDKFK